jgi:hypothetical protein
VNTPKPILKRYARDPDEVLTKGVYSSANAKMYFDDWHMGLIPIVLSSERPKFQVEVDPSDKSEIIAQSLGNKRHLERTFGEFLEKCAQLIILDGGAAFEILVNEQVTNFELFDVDYSSLTISGNKVIQTIPSRVNTKEHTVSISSDNVLLMPCPNWIEGGLGFKSAIKFLIDSEKRNFGTFDLIRKDMETSEKRFDFEEFQRQQFIGLFKALKSGWSARSLHDSRVTEFYLVKRYLRFKKCQIMLRDHLLACVNEQLLPKLRAKGLTINSIGLSGLVSVNDIEVLERRIETGDVSLLEAFKRSRS